MEKTSIFQLKKKKKEGEYFYPDPKSDIDIERDGSRTQTHSGSEDLFYDYLYMIGKYVENMGKPVFFIHPKHCMPVLINYEKYGNLKKTLEKIEDENSFCNCGNTNCQGEENFYINEMRN